jgi:pimeloyl-ACP methyl ester carboxylesterase
MGEVDPGAALAATDVPVLLIHGAADRSTPVRHAHLLAAARAGTPLWVVAGAGHTGSWSTAGRDYEDRVLAFLADSPCPPPIEGVR